MGTRASVIVLLAVVTGCSGAHGNKAASSAKRTSLVGEWQRVVECMDRVNALKKAGFPEFVLFAASELVPGAMNHPEKIADPSHPCKGALRHRKHSHFFTANGKFGSRDFNGKQVDDGTYKLVGDRTFILNGSVKFHYAIQGDTAMFDPVIPAHCSSKECRQNAAYGVQVAQPGMKWTFAGSVPISK